jgi:LAGLIDADG-like domain
MQATTPRGFSADTEILTRRGWVTFDQLTYLDEVASRSPDGRFEWQHPERITWQRYSGEMIWFHGRKADLLVSPDLQMPWLTDSRCRVLHFSPAQEIMDRPTKPSRSNMAAFLIATSEWHAPDLTEKIFPGIRHSRKGPQPRDVSMTGDQFAAFMGMYIAEGSATRAYGGSGGVDWLTAISQTPNGKGYEEYRAVLIDIFGTEPGKSNYGTVWVLHLRALYDYLSPLGQAKLKRIPPDVLNLSRRQLEIFWRYYFLGDGSYCRDYQIVATASKQMAGELQEIIQKLGWSAGVREEKTRANALVKSSGIIYKLGARTTVRPSCNIDAIPYTGMVGNTDTGIGPVYVRRNGQPAWAGL